jgi:hypothetical protein
MLRSSSSKDPLEYLLYDSDFQTTFFNVQENILNALWGLYVGGNISTSLNETAPVSDP